MLQTIKTLLLAGDTKAALLLLDEVSRHSSLIFSNPLPSQLCSALGRLWRLSPNGGAPSIADIRDALEDGDAAALLVIAAEIEAACDRIEADA